MNKIIRIYCEGGSGSHDYDILSKIIEVPVHVNVEIKPIGSVRGAGAIIQDRELIGPVRSDFKFFFRDRDFDRPIPQNVTLERDNNRKYWYYSYRNTIENYLFNISVFFSFLKDNNLCDKYSLPSEDAVKSKFIEAAERIKHYQAVRHAMGKMRTGDTNFGTRWTEKSGKLPENLDEEYCKNKAWDRIEKAKSIADNWTKENFIKCYQGFLALFDKGFMETLDFFIYFQGKDFASSLTSLLSGFSLNQYYKFAKIHFDYKQFPDLVQLRKLIEDNL